MRQGSIGTLEDIQDFFRTHPLRNRLNQSSIYNTDYSSINVASRKSSNLNNRLPSRHISIDKKTKEEALAYEQANAYPYHHQAHEIDELFHWMTDYRHIFNINDTQHLASCIRARIKHPILVYSAATQHLVQDYTRKVGLKQTKELLKESCIRWNKTTSYPIRKWGRVHNKAQQEGYRLELWTTQPFEVFLNTLLHPERVITRDNFLQRYSTKATDSFNFKYGKKPAYTIAMGIELELENLTTPDIPILQETLGDHAIFKQDGSVSNGVEICTAPATLDIHKEIFANFFNKETALEVQTNCGLHVHVDRKGLQKTQIPKILMFMNATENNNFIEQIAGRSANNYCQTEALTWTSAITQPARDKYRRVNLAPDKTIEFRLFASTKNLAQFSRCLEFVQAIVDYTKSGEYDCSIKDMVKKEHFEKYIITKRQFYPELFKFMNPTLVKQQGAK